MFNLRFFLFVFYARIFKLVCCPERLIRYKQIKSERQINLILSSVLRSCGSGSGSGSPTLPLTLSDPECGAGQDDLLWCASCGEGSNQEVLAAVDSPSTHAACSKCGGALEHSKVPTISAELGQFFNFNSNPNVYFEKEKRLAKLRKKLLDVFHRNMQFLLWYVVLHFWKCVVTIA